jgi:ABC-type polar amino acid transport system ATPase subunit
MTDPVIEVCGVRKSFGDLEVLRDVCLSVGKGQVAVLIGPSGSGKSTLLRCINGLETFDGGRVRVGSWELHAGGMDRSRDATLKQIRREVGMVFQGFHLFPHLNVLRNVTEAPIRVLGLDRHAAEARARALLDRVGLIDKIDARPGQLSGGQQQRVAIARTLAMEPEVILFDEPTSALDPRATGDVLAVMTDLAREGQTMIVVSHAMNFARQAANTVHVFGRGYVVESGPPGQIFEAPETEEARLFLAETRAA